jgi:glycosyltransferase involved in cell wall biosynthesis
VSDLAKISIIIPTYNRHAHLTLAIKSVLPQAIECGAEILIVDNNSSDETRQTVSSVTANHPHTVRYVFEPRQGNSYARNTGIQQSRGDIVAFIDDDVVVADDWLQVLISALAERPHVSFVGGKVLPLWSEQPPEWLTIEHWAPLAILDYGPQELEISSEAPLGLLTANIAFRRNVFVDVGLFLPSLQRVKNEIGSMEDHEFLLRALRSGKSGLYLPDLIARASVDPERMKKDYHRRWHRGHGHFYAVMRDEEWERSKFRFVGVPGHLYKQTAMHAVVWCSRVLRGKPDAAFANECNLRFFYGFFRERRKRLSGGA